MSNSPITGGASQTAPVALPSLASESTISRSDASPGKTLFVGDSYTHGKFSDVRLYNAANVHDLNANAPQGSWAQENPKAGGGEGGPWGGIPGIYQAFATEQGLQADTSIEARSATTLKSHAKHAGETIGDKAYDNVILQDKGDAGLDPGVNPKDSATDPGELASGSKKLADGAHANNPDAKVYLNENIAAPDGLHGQTSEEITGQNHKNFAAAAANPDISGVAPVGDAFQRAIDEGVASASAPPKGKATVSADGKNNDVLQPTERDAAGNLVTNPNVSADGKVQLYGQDDHHASSAGSYLSSLVQYGRVTKIDPRTVDANNKVAQDLKIPNDKAEELRRVAAEQLYAEGVPLHTLAP